MATNFTNEERNQYFYPNRIDIHELKEGDTLWFLEKDVNRYTASVDFVIHEVKCKNIGSEPPPYSFGGLGYEPKVILCCDFEFYDKKRMCNRAYHKTQKELDDQPKYEGRFFTNFEQAEKARIEAELKSIEGFLKECHEATQLALSARNQVERLLIKKNIFDEDLLKSCDDYFKHPSYNAHLALYEISDTLKKKLKENSNKETN